MQRNRFLGDILTQLFDRRSPLRGKDDKRDIDAVLTEGRTPLDADQAKVAVFYSISNCQKGLTGISFGNLLIKQVVAELSIINPQIGAYVTLSPIPGLNKWLARQTGDKLLGKSAIEIPEHRAKRETIRAMAARDLPDGKREDGLPRDPVARFHLGIGAEVHDIHATADMPANGLDQSTGALVNYLYDLTQTEKNHAGFAMAETVPASRTVKSLSTATLTPKEATP